MKERKWSLSVVSNSLPPLRLWPIRLLRTWDFPGKSTGVGCHHLLQGTFPIQGSNPGLLNCRQMLFPCEPSGKSWISAHSSTGTLSDLIPWIYLSFPLHNHKRFGLGIPEWSSGYSYFLQFKAEFCNKEFMIGATVSSWSCFCWLYRASPPLAAKNIINWFWYWPSGDVHV